MPVGLPVWEAFVDEAEKQRSVALALAVQEARHSDAAAQRGHFYGLASEQLGRHFPQPVPAAVISDASLLLLGCRQRPPG